MGKSSRRFAEQLNHRQLYATQEEIDYLRELAPSLATVVILGAGPGIMATALKDGNIDVSILLIDNDTCHYAMAHLADFNVSYILNVRTRVQDSAKAGMGYPGPPIDLLIVDADHTEIGVRSDIAAWLEHVRVDGTMLFHDYDASDTVFAGQEQYPGVKVAVEALLREYEHVGRVGTSMVVRNAPSR